MLQALVEQNSLWQAKQQKKDLKEMLYISGL
jgi:hypothetical protein